MFILVFKVQALREIQKQFPLVFHEVFPENLDGCTVDIKEKAKDYTFGITRDTLFGLSENDNVQMDMDAMTDFLGLINECQCSSLKRFIYKFYKPPHVREPVEKLKKIVSDIIKVKYDAIKQQSEDEPYYAKDILDMLIAHSVGQNESLSQRDLIGEVFTLALAGTETTSNIISCLIYKLGHEPEIQQRIYDEIMDEGILNEEWDDLSSLQYTMQVTLEGLRYFNTVGTFGRDALEPIDLGDDKVIPPGVRLTFLSMYVHKNKEYWPNPEKFDPDRFSKENYTNKQRKAFFPFGWGPRMCIGQLMAKMEIVTFLVMFLSRYKVESTKKEIEMVEHLTRQPKYELNVTLTAREE